MYICCFFLSRARAGRQRQKKKKGIESYVEKEITHIRRLICVFALQVPFLYARISECYLNLENNDRALKWGHDALQGFATLKISVQAGTEEEIRALIGDGRTSRESVIQDIGKWHNNTDSNKELKHICSKRRAAVHFISCDRNGSCRSK